MADYTIKVRRYQTESDQGAYWEEFKVELEPSLSLFLTVTQTMFEPESGNPRLIGVIVTADDKTGRATAITRISYSDADLTALTKTTEPVHAHQR